MFFVFVYHAFTKLTSGKMLFVLNKKNKKKIYEMINWERIVNVNYMLK